MACPSWPTARKRPWPTSSRAPGSSTAVCRGTRGAIRNRTNRNCFMTDTVISSQTREIVIGLERPFVMIGERINPTGRKILAAEMAAGDFSRVESDGLARVAAGAHMLDVNAGIPLADEPAI